MNEWRNEQGTCFALTSSSHCLVNSYSHEVELLKTCNRANFSLKRLPTVEENSYVHWLAPSGYASASLVQVQLRLKSTKIPDYNIANFDVLKLPVLEVCFYTPRSESESSVT